MSPTQEQKKEIRIARKKRKRLDRKEASEAKNATLHYSIHTQVSCSRRNPGNLEEPNCHKELASKYYSQWSMSAGEKKEVAKLWDKKHQRVYKSRCLHCVMQISVNNDCLLHLMNRDQFRISYDIPDALHYIHNS